MRAGVAPLPTPGRGVPPPRARPQGVAGVAGVAGVLLALVAAPALAHDGKPLAPHDLWGAWAIDPVVIVSLVLSAALYVRGTRALWRRAPRRGVTPARAAAFAAGWLVLAVALVSPLHAMGESLLSAHMVQHELLIAVGAPLVVAGRPLVPWLWALSPAWRRRLGQASKSAVVRRPWRLLAHPGIAWVLHSVALWGWHAPGAYQASVRGELAHALQHTSFLVTALLLWYTVLEARRRRAGVALLSLFGLGMHTAVLGALLTVSGTLWYPVYDGRTAPWGLTPLEDQQLGGLVMWVPACASYLLAAMWIGARWLREPDVPGRRAEGAWIPAAPEAR